MEPKVLQEHIEAALSQSSTDAHITFRPMFGGILGYCDGRPFVSLSNVGLAFKLSAKDQEELLSQSGADRLRYEPSDPPSKQYIVVPERFLRDQATLAGWMERSLKYARSLPVKKRK